MNELFERYKFCDDFTLTEAAMLWQGYECDITPIPHPALGLIKTLRKALPTVHLLKWQEFCNGELPVGEYQKWVLQAALQRLENKNMLFLLADESCSGDFIKWASDLTLKPYRDESCDPLITRFELYFVAEYLGDRPKFLGPWKDPDSIDTREKNSLLSIIQVLWKLRGEGVTEAQLLAEVKRLGYVKTSRTLDKHLEAAKTLNPCRK